MEIVKGHTVLLYSVVNIRFFGITEPILCNVKTVLLNMWLQGVSNVEFYIIVCEQNQ